MTTLIAFHGDPAIKEKYLKRIIAHREADEIIKGTYWENGKGCAVGCTIHSGEHGKYEIELGIPQQLARIEDGLFEALPNGTARDWPAKFLSSIPVGANLYIAYWSFMLWLLIDRKDGVIRFAKTDRTKKSIQDVASLYRHLLAGENLKSSEFRAAAAAAYDAAAAYAAAAAAAAAAAYRSSIRGIARVSARERQGERLLELLAEAPVVNLV